MKYVKSTVKKTGTEKQPQREKQETKPVKKIQIKEHKILKGMGELLIAAILLTIVFSYIGILLTR